ncbi:MAG TPA: two-component regulator propeller domain-containing protein [Vicinamibacterales bacterium]|nr:two-component regulator propeller domain-containing protein [Vicinamibacterales bacterium]
MNSAPGAASIVATMRSAALLAALVTTTSPRLVAGAPAAPAPNGPSVLSLANYALTNWSEEQGPFPFGVYAIAQDHDGYLWLGTRSGLVRFDGSEFTPWNDTHQLPDDRVSAILAARDGSLWVGFGTIGGVAQVSARGVRQFTVRDGLADGDVNTIVQDPGGAIWVASHGGLSVYDGQRWRTVDQRDGLPAESVLSLWVDTGGRVWTGTSTGIYRRAGEGERFTVVEPRGGGEFAEDRAGTVWVTDPNEAFRATDQSGGRERAPGGRRGSGRNLLVDTSGALWVGTRGAGIMRVAGDAAGVHPERIEYVTRRQGLISDEIRTLFQDQNGSLWVGSRRGLSRLAESTVGSGKADTESFVAAVAVTRDGATWTATADGAKRQRGDETRTFTERDGLPSRIVTALHEDRNGTLWAATALGVARLIGPRFVPLPLLDRSSWRDYQIRSMTSGADGALWLCDQRSGLFRWKDGVTESLTGEIGSRKAYVAYADRMDRVWIGFWEGGVSVFAPSGATTSYTSKQGLPTGPVNIIYEDRSGRIWVATEHGLGLVQGQRIRTFATNGLPESAVVSMNEDQTGTLWIGFGPSLMRIDPHEFDRALEDPAYAVRYRLYGMEDGLPGSLGRPGLPSSARTADDRLLFVTSDGLAEVDPRRLRDRPAPRLLGVSSVHADGQALAPANGAVTIPAGVTRLEIKYSLLSLSASKFRFRHMLDGFDPDWHVVGDKREVSYTNLPPGRYRFRVATDHDGAWIESRTPLEMTIQPAFYQTTTFYAGVASSLAMLIWFGWRRRVRSIQREFNLVLGERARVGREIHDTLLQSLVAVELEFDDISEQLDSSKAALKAQVIAIRTRVEQYIVEARHSISNLRSPMLAQSDLATALKRSGETATRRHGSRFEFSMQGMPRPLDEPLEDQLLRIGQEAVNNAVRHSLASVIRLELRFEPSAVRLRVSDDGKGFDPGGVSGQQNEHWGLAGMRERAANIGAQLRVVSQPGAGTTIEALVPQGQH